MRLNPTLVFRLFSCALAPALLAACSSALFPAPTRTPEPEMDAFTMNQRLAKTVNLGNALEAPNEGEWGVTLKEEYFRLIKQKGFTAIRLPVRWSTHALKEAPYSIDPEFFERVDWAVEQALANDLAIVVNMHHYEEMATDPNGHRERYLALWKQIAEHYQSYPNAVLLEPMNEPNGVLSAELWNSLVAEVLPVIRATNPTRNLVIGPADWNNMSSLKKLTLPAADRHIIVTVHYYSPFQFTHQGAEWAAGSDAWLGIKWGSKNDQSALKYDFSLVEQWARENKRPIFVGEFGAYSKADMDSRVKWTAAVARMAESRGFSWGHWEFCAGFGVYDPANGQWREPLVQALLPPQ